MELVRCVNAGVLVGNDVLNKSLPCFDASETKDHV